MSNSFKREWRVLQFVWRAAKGKHGILVGAMIMNILIGLMPAAVVYVIGRGTLHTADILSLLTWDTILWFLLLCLLYMVLCRSVELIQAFVMADVEFRLREQFMQRWKQIPYEYIVNKVDHRNANSIVMETGMATALLPMVYRSFLRAPVTIVAFLLVMLSISVQMTLMMVGVVILLVVLVFVLRRHLKRSHRQLYDDISGLYQRFDEWLSGYRVFRIFGVLDFASQRMTDTFDRIRAVNKRLAWYTNAQSLLVEFLTYAAISVMILMMSGTEQIISWGIVLSFPAAILFIRNEAICVFAGYQQLATTESDISRLIEVLERPTERTEKRMWTDAIRSLEMQGVSVAFEEGGSVLQETSLSLESGGLHVLTGTSGSGKTTTLNVLLGLLEPQEGQVRINGLALSDFDPESVLQQVAIVEQEPFIFEGTVLENVLMGRACEPDTLQEIVELFGRLGMQKIVGSTADLQDRIGPLARQLSSGEKQRLAIVRALIGKPSLLVLDEVTSHVDRTSAEEIIRLIKEKADDMFIVAVSHDTSLVRAASQVWVLCDGKWHKEGTNGKS